MTRIATRTSRRTHLFALLLLTPALTGCHSWQTATIGPRELIETHEPEEIRVTRSDGTLTHVSDPRVEGDSIVAVVPDVGTVSIALADIEAVEAPRLSVLRTAAASVAGLAGAAYLWGLGHLYHYWIFG